MVSRSSSSPYSRKHIANVKLRYAIAVLQGKEFKAPRGMILAHVLDIKDWFEENNYWWQKKILNHWIHRFQRGDFNHRFTGPRRGPDSPRGGEGAS